MGTALQPPINTLGIAAPYLGPWFDPDINLAAPDTSPLQNTDLSVTLQFAGNTNWLPPATGLLGLHVTSTPRPKALALLRNPQGGPAFDDNRLVVLYTLLPEVADRLDSLMDTMAAADGSAAGNSSTRAKVRHIALQMPDTNFTWLNRLLPLPEAGMLNPDIATLFGLVLNADNTTVSNSAHPMADLKTPGKLPLIGTFEPMMVFAAADVGIRMFAFDHRGRPIDPGAVAAWWAALGATFPGLWAPGLSTNAPTEQRTVGVANAFSVHIVNAHEGAVDSTLQARLNLAGMAGGDAFPLFARQAGQTVSIGFTAAPTDPDIPDDAPVPRAAALPSGRYQNQVQLWANAGSTPVQRDFVRVAVVELEEHLVGQKRTQPQPPTTPEAAKRATDQQRTTTRVNIAQSAAPALIATVDGAAAAALAVISGNNAQVVTGTLDPDWGPLNGMPAGAMPPAFPGLLQAMLPPVGLMGGDANANAIPKLGQRVLIQFTALPVAIRNCWLRAWPVGFNVATGDRTVMTGGAGLIDGNGNVSLVVELPDGAGTGQLGVRFAVTAPGGFTREYTEQRFTRPNQAGGGSNGVAWGMSGNNNVILCEQGLTVPNNPAPVTQIASGTTVVEVIGGNFALIDRSTIPAGSFAAVSAATSFAAGDTIELTQPAFKATPDGVVGAGVAGAGMWNAVALNRTVRTGIDPLTADSQPYSSQERLENACASRAAATACVWTAPSLSRYHEVGAHNAGHPGAPATVEIHGTGVALNGPAAFLIAEHTEDRISKTGAPLVNAAVNAPAVPAAPAGSSIWAAALKTVAATVEGEHSFGDKVISPNDATKAYTFEPVVSTPPGRKYESNPEANSDIKKWYHDNLVTTVGGIDVLGTPLPSSNPGQPGAWTPAQINAAKRAMDRRALEAAWGLRESLWSISKAFSRAEDFVYIETPALDLKGIGPDIDQVLIQLLGRLTDNPQLRLILCIPNRLMPGWPKSIELIRNKNTQSTLSALQLAGGDRVAVFSPAAGQGREVRLSSTTVIVDDAYAITGTTHLWRRGMSFDSSLSVAVFDEVLNGGRPADIVAFRRALLANQLSLPAGRIPDDPAALVEIIQLYNKQKSARVGQTPLKQPKLPPDSGQGWSSDDGWNPDGSYKAGASILGLLTDFLTSNQDSEVY